MLSVETGLLRAKRKSDDISCTSLAMSLKKLGEMINPMPLKSSLNEQLSTTMPLVMMMTSLRSTVCSMVSSR